MDKKTDLRAALFCFAASAVLLLICSMNSYLYPLNPWVDVNCFVTVGKGMLEGLVPYRDLIEQKGPLLYALHALTQLVSPGDYHGIYWLEVLLLSGSLMMFWKIARLYVRRISVGWVILPAVVLLTSRAFKMGDSAEELCILPAAFSMYDLLRARGRADGISLPRYVLNGFLAGCILWIKFSLLGFHFVWMAYLAIETLAEERSVLCALKRCGAFLLGMLLSGVPWLIYFGANGTLGELVDIYILNTAVNYGRSGNGIWRNVVRMLMESAEKNPAYAALLACGGICAMVSCRLGWREKLFLIASAAGTCLGAFCRGGFDYYCVILAVFLPFSMLLPGWVCEKLGARKGRCRWLCPAALTCGALCALMLSANAQYIGYPYEKTAQGQAAAVAKCSEGDTLLNVGGLDAGFYYAMDMRPADRWFCWLNVSRRKCLEEQAACVERKEPRYVICNVPALEEYGFPATYELAYTFETDYAAKLGACSRCYLLERKEG